MTHELDIDKLEELANEVKDEAWPFYGIPFSKAATPTAILALIERLRVAEVALHAARNMVAYSASGMTHSGDMTNMAMRTLAKIDAAIARKDEA